MPPDVAQTVSDALSLYEFSYKPEPDYYVLQYIRRSYSCWGKVKDRDQSFFEENAAGIFAGIDPKTQDMYKFIALVEVSRQRRNSKTSGRAFSI